MIASGGLHGIYAIVNEGTSDTVALGALLLEGGIRILQYRAKGGVVPAHVRALRESTKRYGALFIVNDNCEAALEHDADGVHLGPEDAERNHLPAIRERLGTCLLGLSCGTSEEARHAQAIGADYIGVGAVYATDSKADAGVPIGLEGLRRVAASTTLPVAAIGGITLDNLHDVAASGVAMAAMLSAFTASALPLASAQAAVRVWLAR